LTVISRESAAPYKGRAVDARTAGHALGARAVVRGRIERRDDELVVTAELVDAGDNGIIWSQQYGIKPAEIAARQSEIAKDIHEHIHFH
jgi:TolB-like protein